MKILVIRFSSIGDIVLTTPVVRCLKTQLPNVQVHYLTKATYSAILNANPYVDEVIELQKKMKYTIKKLRQEKYDAVIDLHNNQRTWIIKRKLGVVAQSYKKLNLEKWLLVNFKVNRLPNVHIVDRYMDTVKHLGVQNDNKGLDYFIPKIDEVDITTLPAAFQNGYTALVIGAQHETKKLPLHKLVELCNATDKPIVLLGGPDDEANAKEITKQSTATIYNAVGKYKLHGSASLIKQATLVVSHDTGLMHIAAAFNKPIVSVWGNTVPAFGMYPYFGETKPTVDVQMQIADLKCRPCSKIGYQSCPKGHFKCMSDIDTQAIANIANNG